jgi:hypothetical protein
MGIQNRWSKGLVSAWPVEEPDVPQPLRDGLVPGDAQLYEAAGRPQDPLQDREGRQINVPPIVRLELARRHATPQIEHVVRHNLLVEADGVLGDRVAHAGQKGVDEPPT